MDAASKKRKGEEAYAANTIEEDAGVEDAELRPLYAIDDELGVDREDVMKMLEPLERDTMMEIIQESCSKYPGVVGEVRRFVDRDPAHRKLFVRGLGWDTTSETLQSVFSQFGEIEEGTVIRDKNTQKSRGFGFVTYSHMDGAVRALKHPSKRIDGRMTVCQFASWAPSVAQPLEEVSARKIYVGNVPVGLTADKVLGLFSQFGEIAEGPLGFDKATGLSRGFALIIYKNSGGARAALVQPYKTIDGQQVHCKLAMEGYKQQQVHQQQNIQQQEHQQVLSSKPEPESSPAPQFNAQAVVSGAVPGAAVPLSQSPLAPLTTQNQRPNSFQPPNFPSIVSVPQMYNYNHPAAMYGAQSAGYTSAPFYVTPAANVALQTAHSGTFSIPYPNLQQVTVPLPLVPGVQAIPNLPSTYGS